MGLVVDERGYPILNQFSDDGFVDCVLKIINRKDSPDLYRFDLRACYDGFELGFGVEVVKAIRGGFDEDMHLIQSHVYKKGVKFYRTGQESDNLISVLALLYGFDDFALKMCDEEVFTAIALHQGEIDMISEAIKIKLFGNDQDEDLEHNYYESFFNLDLKNGLVCWNEKDQDYRSALVLALSSGKA